MLSAKCVVSLDDGCDDSAQPSKSQSSADLAVDEQPTSRTRHRRLLHVDGRSSSETSAGSGDKLALDDGRSAAVLRGLSVDEGNVHTSNNVRMRGIPVSEKYRDIRSDGIHDTIR